MHFIEATAFNCFILGLKKPIQPPITQFSFTNNSLPKKVFVFHCPISFEFTTITTADRTIIEPFNILFLNTYRLVFDNCHSKRMKRLRQNTKRQCSNCTRRPTDVNAIWWNYSYTIKWALSLMTISTDEAVIFYFMFWIVCNNALMLRFCGRVANTHNVMIVVRYLSSAQTMNRNLKRSIIFFISSYFLVTRVKLNIFNWLI